MTASSRQREALREYALGLPEAYEDHPWGEDVAKMRKKVFVFLGVDEFPGLLVTGRPTLASLLGPLRMRGP